MRLVLELDLPWMAYCDDLADTEPNGCINYSKFLERYRIEMANIDESWKEAVIERICERLFQVANNIEAFYKQFDVNDDGKIEYLEFVSALESLNLGLTRSQIYELMGSIDMDKDGCIDFEEFANRQVAGALCDVWQPSPCCCWWFACMNLDLVLI
jgi:protein phosphatase